MNALSKTNTLQLIRFSFDLGQESTLFQSLSPTMDISGDQTLQEVRPSQHNMPWVILGYQNEEPYGRPLTWLKTCYEQGRVDIYKGDAEISVQELGKLIRRALGV